MANTPSRFAFLYQSTLENIITAPLSYLLVGKNIIICLAFIVTVGAISCTPELVPGITFSSEVSIPIVSVVRISGSIVAVPGLPLLSSILSIFLALRAIRIGLGATGVTIGGTFLSGRSLFVARRVVATDVSIGSVNLG